MHKKKSLFIAILLVVAIIPTVMAYNNISDTNDGTEAIGNVEESANLGSYFVDSESITDTESKMKLEVTSEIVPELKLKSELTSESQTAPLPLRAGELSPRAAEVFKVLVFVDTASYWISEAEIKQFFEETGVLLEERTGTTIEVVATWYVNLSEQNTTTSIVAQKFEQSPDLLNEANGIVFFTDNVDCSKTYGGCAWPLYPTAISGVEYCNTFDNIEGETDLLYGSFVNWGHKFGACGYDNDGVLVSDVSLADGTCQNQANVPCVMKNGYSMCSTSVDKHNAIDRYMMNRVTIVHEIMHHFGEENEGYNHYGTEACAQYPVPDLDFECEYTDAECYFQMCPYTYQNFINSENQCDDFVADDKTP